MVRLNMKRLLGLAGVALCLAAPNGVAASSLAGDYLAGRQASFDGDIQAAAKHYGRAVMYDSANPVILERAALAEISLGNVKRAASLASKLVSDGNRSQVAQMALVAESAQTEDYEALIEAINDDRGVGALVDGLLLAWSHLGAGDITAALVQFDELAGQQGLANFAMYHKALALASVGDFESAGAILEDAGPAGSERAQQQQSLLRRQLPHITQRLQLALDKLQQPTKQVNAASPLGNWWEQLVARHSVAPIEFLPDIGNPALGIPADCFDSVIENLLDNARNKAKTSDPIQIKVGLYEKDGDVVISVVDNGKAMAPALAARLFTQPVSSDNGLGIGLFQSAQQAAVNGYRLILSENEDGAVRFTLTNRG